MKLLEKLIMKPAIFQRTLGLNFEQFTVFIERIKPIWEKAEHARKARESRKREIGGGRNYEKTLTEMMVIVLLYYKTYMTQEFIGIISDLDQANVSRLLKKMLPLMEKAADPQLAIYLAQAKAEFENIPKHQRISTWSTFLKKHPDLQEVSTDATEQQCYRSANYETQKKYYSGKSKQHSVKTQLSVSQAGRILDVSATVPGSVHDKKLADQEGTMEKFPEKTAHRLDSGYQGIATEHPNSYIIPIIKKARGQERSSLEKELNRVNSKRRVIVENVISRVKKFKISAGLYRGVIDDYNQIFRNIAALINFKLVNPVATI